MTKNIIEISKLVLGKFKNIRGDAIIGRFVRPPEEQLEAGIELLKQSKIGRLALTSDGVRVIDYELNDKRYVALTMIFAAKDISSIENDSKQTIRATDVPEPIYLMLAHRLELNPIVSDYQLIEQYIEGPATTDIGVEVDAVRSRLEHISVFQIDANAEFEAGLPSIYIANYLRTFRSDVNSKGQLSARSLQIIRRIFSSEKEQVFDTNLFDAISSPISKHAFLEVYRMLEFIFVLPRAKALILQLQQSSGLSADVKVLEFARSCYKQLGWKRIERDSVEKLFQEHAVNNIADFKRLASDCGPFKNIVAPTGNDPDEQRRFVANVAEIYYSLRNQVVHQFWPDEIVTCAEKDWGELIEFTLSCTDALYSQHLRIRSTS